MALYNELLWELRPSSTHELGSEHGASADWFATMSAAFGFEADIVSFDADPPEQEIEVSFVRAVFPDDISVLIGWTEILDHSRPGLIVEDMHVGVDTVLPANAETLQPGDYLVIEDSASKQDVIRKLSKGPTEFLVDQHYTDRFGVNGTSAMNSVLKVKA